MARVLILGAGGGLGKAWSARLARPGATLEPAIPGPVEVTALRREDVDISRRDRVEEAFESARPDVVLNCSGRTQVDACENSPWEAFLVHRDGADHVARLCAARGALPVYFGSDLVFDGGRSEPYGEDDPPNPLSVFGDSKLAGELMTMKHARRHLVVRAGWVYGQPGRHFLRVFEDGVTSGEILFGYDDQMGQATWIEDLLDGVLHLLRNGHQGRWHLGSAGRATQFGVMRRLKELLGLDSADLRPIQRVVGGRHALRPRFSVLDTSRLAATGFTLPPWEERLALYAERIRLGARKERDTRIATK